MITKKKTKKKTLFIHSDGSDTSVDVEQPIKLDTEEETQN